MFDVLRQVIYLHYTKTSEWNAKISYSQNSIWLHLTHILPIVQWFHHSWTKQLIVEFACVSHVDLLVPPLWFVKLTWYLIFWLKDDPYKQINLSRSIFGSDIIQKEIKLLRTRDVAFSCISLQFKCLQTFASQVPLQWPFFYSIHGSAFLSMTCYIHQY